jgi:hypothetical protein
MKKRISIIHFSPIELYPPVLNLIDYLSKENIDIEIQIYSTDLNSCVDKYENSSFKINRYKSIVPTSSILLKLLSYLNFNVSVFLNLLAFKPTSILYFETLSAIPAILYKSIRNTKILVHYHEIVTLEELKNGRKLNSFINNIEKDHYDTFKWISQTNYSRLAIFIDQYKIKKGLQSLKVLPNYPPKIWLEHPKCRRNNNTSIRLLHIGALSKEGLYLNEVLDRFGSNPKYTIDFYSHNFNSDVKEIILAHKSCRIMGAISYKDIPKLKGLYDVGLVLYKGSSENVIYSAPNKIFEYLALDLDVWCSNKLITSKEYVRSNCYPKMLLVDYSKLENFDVKNALNKVGLNYQASPFFCESIYLLISKELLDKEI